MAAKKSGKKRNEATPRQMKLIDENKSYSEAAIAAGYSGKNERQSGYHKRCNNYAAAFQICMALLQTALKKLGYEEVTIH